MWRENSSIPGGVLVGQNTRGTASDDAANK